MKKIALLTVLFACLAACSRQKPADFGGSVIDGPGTFNCFNGGLVVKVTHGPGDQLNYSVENKDIAAASAKPALRKSAPWFIFPESSSKVWIFDGTQDVTLIELYGRGTKFTSGQVVPELLKQAPRALLEKLPADVRGEVPEAAELGNNLQTRKDR